MFVKKKKVVSKRQHEYHDKFMKILIACGATLEDLKERVWTIEETSPYCYHCIGDHPVLLRKDLRGENIIV